VSTRSVPIVSDVSGLGMVKSLGGSALVERSDLTGPADSFSVSDEWPVVVVEVCSCSEGDVLVSGL
jgi:hypothetical protein